MLPVFSVLRFDWSYYWCSQEIRNHQHICEHYEMTSCLWGRRKKKVDCYLSGIAMAVWIHIHQIKIVSLLKCNGADCSSWTHSPSWTAAFPFLKPVIHVLIYWIDLPSSAASFPAICLLQHLCCLTSVPISCTSLQLTSLSLSPWLSHSLLRACPALALSKFYSWSVKKNNKKMSEENITTLQNMWPT